MLLVVLPVGEAFGVPVMLVALRRYSNDANRRQAFSLFYVVMNVGTLLSTPLNVLATFVLHRTSPAPLEWFGMLAVLGLAPREHLCLLTVACCLCCVCLSRSDSCACPCTTTW